jgi:hypothetical protein
MMNEADPDIGHRGFGGWVILLDFAYHASNAPLDQLSNKLTGRFTAETMRYLIIGAAAAIGGVLLFLFLKRR